MIVTEAVKKNGFALKYASEELKGDSEIVIEATKQNPYALAFASEELKGNYAMSLIASWRRRGGVLCFHPLVTLKRLCIMRVWDSSWRRARDIRARLRTSSENSEPAADASEASGASGSGDARRSSSKRRALLRPRAPHTTAHLTMNSAFGVTARRLRTAQTRRPPRPTSDTRAL